jgi:hypothetical protein
MRNLSRLFVHHNPFYLLSALSMLLGCFLLSRALAPEPGHAGKLVLLIGVLNLYEALLIGLALFLIVGRGLVRDGRSLLVLESVFLVDATFLGSELYASDLGIGALVAGGLFLLALLKLGTVGRVLRVPLPPPLWFAMAPLAVLLAVPGIFAALAQARLLSLPIVYLLWWVLALLVVIQAAVERDWPAAPVRSPAAAGADALRVALGIAPLASLAAHLIGAGWVQGLGFYPSFLGPLFLALGIRSALREVPSLPRKSSLWWPATGVLVSLGASSDLVVTNLGVPLSPLRVTLVGAGLSYLLAFRIHRLRVFVWSACLCLGAAWAGHTLVAMVSSVTWLWRVLGSWPRRIAPRTTGEWGLLAVGLSFVLLIVGALQSLWRPRTPEPPRSWGGTLR